MHFRTTLLLLVLAGVGGGALYFQDQIAGRFRAAPAAAAVKDETSPTLHGLAPERVNRVEVARDGATVVLERQGTAWSLPGGWPAREVEARELVGLLTGLHSRFVAVPLGGDLKPFGLDPAQNSVRVTVTYLPPNSTQPATHVLLFGEPPAPADGVDNPFVVPTYVRLNNENHALRLAPGLLQVLRRPRDAYQKRQLFAEVQRVRVADSRPTFPGDTEPPAPVVSLLDAKKITLTGPDGAVTLTRTAPAAPQEPKKAGPVETTAERVAARWQITAPVADRPDPEKLKSVLSAVPDLWAEQFVAGVTPEAAGLEKPERTVAVEFDGRGPVTVQIGKVSRVVEKKSPAPPPANPFSPPPPAPPPTREEYRYARLPDNPQIFEVRSDKFPDLFVPLAAMRDPKLFRFRPTDVQRVEIAPAGGKIVLAKQKDESTQFDRWKLVEPVQADAEQGKVTELIDKLAELQATGADVLDADPKTYDLDPAVAGPQVTLTVSEEVPGGADKPKLTRTLTLRVGKQDAAKSKLYVQAAGAARINAVNDDFLKLFDRPVLAYRGRRVLDVPTAKVATIAVERGGEGYTLAQSGGAWQLTAPAAAPAEAAKAGTLAADLGRLEAVEYVNDAPKPEELTKYGLDKPAVSATLTFNDGQPAKTVQLGAAREGKPEVYAKLAAAPGVFAVRQAVRDAVDQPSLAYRPLQLWQKGTPEIASVEVQRGADTYTVTRAGEGWKLTGPFDAPASAAAVQPLADALAMPRAERFEAHKADDLAKYGLDQPALRLTVTATGDAPKALLVGKTTAPDQKSRFAKLADGTAVFVVPEALTQVADRPALDLLERRLLTVDTRQITKVQGTGPDGEWTLVREGDEWKVASLTPPAPADRDVTESVLRPWVAISAVKFAAYGPQTDLAKFGLDKPVETVTITVSPGMGQAPVTHTLALGAPAEGDAGRYARLDNGPGVVVVTPGVAKSVTHSPLDFADRTLFTFDDATLAAIKRTGGDPLELVKKDDGWQIVKPTEHRADAPAMDELADHLSGLRASRVAALDAKELKPFGLDEPAATVTLSVKDKDGKPVEKVLRIGKPTEKEPDERFARVEGSAAVVVLPGPVAKRLTAEPLKFRERALARFADADRAFVERGPRKLFFAKVDGTWRVTEPVAADAEAAELEALISTVSRLRADELIAEKPADLKPYGLDPPELRWRFLAGDREAMQLLVGSLDAKTGRRHAKLANSDLVFFLGPELSAKVAAEYRKRTLWANLDAAQVETLIYAVGGQSLVLQKTDGMWQVQGKPDAMANGATVSDLLGTLAGLRVERYVADKGADFQLYGLQAPERTIIARSRSGTPQTLYLGRYEGDSKRVYARLLDPARTDVFVLSEADSAKLVRELAAFAAK